MARKSGVYLIRCKANGRCYVGASVDIDRRVKDHFYQMRMGWRGLMGEDYKKYGRKGFSATVLEFVNKSDLSEAEKRWSKEFNTEYNIEPPKRNRHWMD